MAQRGYGYGDDAKRHDSILMKIADLGFVVISVVVVIGFVGAMLTPHINPASFLARPILGLIAPVIFLAIVLLELYWIIRWRWRMMLFVGLFLLIGLFDLSLFFKPVVRRDYNNGEYSRNSMLVASYNVRGLYDKAGQSISSDKVAELMMEQEPDIICFQEFSYIRAKTSAKLLSLMDDYNVVVGTEGLQPNVRRPTPLVIMSKYPILGTGCTIESEQDSIIHHSIWADVKVENDTLRVYNNHLESTSISASDEAYISNRGYLTDTTYRSEIRSISSRIQNSSIVRAQQVDHIVAAMESFDGDKIVCGDFNDTPKSYTYGKLSRGLQDCFSEAGRGYSHTYSGFLNLLRIDYILVSESFEVESYEVIDEDEVSDHLPVFARIKITQ